MPIETLKTFYRLRYFYSLIVYESSSSRDTENALYPLPSFISTDLICGIMRAFGNDDISICGAIDILIDIMMNLKTINDCEMYDKLVEIDIIKHLLGTLVESVNLLGNADKIDDLFQFLLFNVFPSTWSSVIVQHADCFEHITNISSVSVAKCMSILSRSLVFLISKCESQYLHSMLSGACVKCPVVYDSSCLLSHWQFRGYLPPWLFYHSLCLEIVGSQWNPQKKIEKLNETLPFRSFVLFGVAKELNSRMPFINRLTNSIIQHSCVVDVSIDTCSVSSEIINWDIASPCLCSLLNPLKTGDYWTEGSIVNIADALSLSNPNSVLIVLRHYIQGYMSIEHSTNILNLGCTIIEENHLKHNEIVICRHYVRS